MHQGFLWHGLRISWFPALQILLTLYWEFRYLSTGSLITSSFDGCVFANCEAHSLFYLQDNEVVVLPGCSISLAGAYVGDVISLGQRNVRTTTYKLQDSAAGAGGGSGKKATGKLCVLVDLQEQ